LSDLDEADPRSSSADEAASALVGERLDATPEGKMAPDREEREHMLRPPAMLLAREPELEHAHVESQDVVEFLLGVEQYAIEFKYIREIQPLRDLTPLPCVPPFVLGLINVRGQILSVIDIRTLLELPPGTVKLSSKVILVQNQKMEIGILVDDILGARAVDLQNFQPLLPTSTGLRTEFLLGVTKDSVVVLDAEMILSDSRIVVDEGVVPAS
jgi:purine-binding chemotaxis protein CheW